MSQNDVEMEDVEKHPHEIKIEESENKGMDHNSEDVGEGKNPPFPATVKMENNREDISESINGDKDSIEAKEQTNPENEGNETIEGSIQEHTDKNDDNEMLISNKSEEQEGPAKEQTNPKSEGNETIEGSIQENLDKNDENEMPISTKTEEQEGPACRSVDEGRMDKKDEECQQNITCDGEEEKSAENCLGGGDHLKLMEEKSIEGVVDEEPKEHAEGDANDVENVRGDNQSNSERDADGAGNVAGDNQTNSPRDADYVEKVAENNKMISKGIGGHVEAITGDNKNSPKEGDDAGGNITNFEGHAEDAENMEEDDKVISKGDADCAENAAGDEKTISEAGADVENAGDNRTVSEGCEDIESVEGEKMEIKREDSEDDPSEHKQLPTELSTNKAPQIQDAEMGEVDGTNNSTNLDGDKTVMDASKEQDGETVHADPESDENAKTTETSSKHDDDPSFANEQEPSTPNSLIRDSSALAEDHSGGGFKSTFSPTTLPLLGEKDDGTPEEQVAFMKEIENFYRQRALDFKPPKFYGHPLNCLKLWRAVIRLGGYDRVTASKLWRQVGESFHPPKTCTTVSWTFRIFYEKSLLEYERHKILSGDLQLSAATLPEASGGDVEGNGCQALGRVRRDAATRAIQGWHAQRHSEYGEVGEPIVKDKNLNNVPKREKNLKSIGSAKQKRPSEAENSNKAARTETSRQLVTSVVDVGPPADWVRINVRQAKDCFEIYALVPGLLREERRFEFKQILPDVWSLQASPRKLIIPGGLHRSKRW
ncbi:AT-rich interactive domain-containing protein 3-like isoform X2 [Andrographis paniculata]|uniref:AT-rich interactive domain-containing protein 3-like isoform X2 n=1 Tax=Andrographis paniculata TaxID=175694 RepID=UPI0021E7A14C|nr:AT-rich interactive domain-containing protein 3-like isoform X2 [Andrographis paniculata]